MAKVGNGFPAKREKITFHGKSHTAAGGAVTLTTLINGHSRKWSANRESPHVPAYYAAIEAMIAADEAGVTHLELQTPANLVRRQATGTFATREPDLVLLRALCELLENDFDDVDWLKGPA